MSRGYDVQVTPWLTDKHTHYYYYYYYRCKDYSDAITQMLQGHFTIVTVRLNSKQYDGSGDRPQTLDGQVSFRWNCGEKEVCSVLGGRSVGTARYWQTLEVHSTFLPRPLGTRGRQEWTALYTYATRITFEWLAQLNELNLKSKLGVQQNSTLHDKDNNKLLTILCSSEGQWESANVQTS